MHKYKCNKCHKKTPSFDSVSSLKCWCDVNNWDTNNKKKYCPDCKDRIDRDEKLLDTSDYVCVGEIIGLIITIGCICLFYYIFKL